MLRNVQNKPLNQVAYTGRTMKEATVLNNKLTSYFKDSPSLLKGPSYNGLFGPGAVMCFIKGATCGTLKVASIIAKLPFKMLEAPTFLAKEFKELGAYIRSESNLAKATLRAKGHDTIAKILTKDIKFKD